jgi:hypothetical protein
MGISSRESRCRVPDARLVAAGEGDDCSLDGVGRLVFGVSGKGDGRCLIRLEHLIMPVWVEPWMGEDCEWPLEDRIVSAAVNPIYAHGASGFFILAGWRWIHFHVIVWDDWS